MCNWMSAQRTKLLSAAQTLKNLSPLRPTLAVVLGTGFRGVSTEIEIEAKVTYGRLPGFPPAGVTGHTGEVLIGRLGRTPVMVLSGRAHFYEGWSMAEVTFPICAMAEYGIGSLLLTNAAGGLNPKF